MLRDILPYYFHIHKPYSIFILCPYNTHLCSTLQYYLYFVFNRKL